jgi:tellurite resistance protein TerB
MSIWNNLRDKVQQMSTDLQTRVSKFRNADFSKASMAMCSMIAAADGSVSGPEKTKIAALISNNETLKIFSASELKEQFDFFCNKMTSDYDFGKLEAIQAIGKLRNKPDQARAVIQIGIIIGGADGNFDANEKKAVREACNAVGIAPSEFDL